MISPRSSLAQHKWGEGGLMQVSAAEAAESTKEHRTDCLDPSAACVRGEGGRYLKLRDFFKASEDFWSTVQNLHTVSSPSSPNTQGLNNLAGDFRLTEQVNKEYQNESPHGQTSTNTSTLPGYLIWKAICFNNVANIQY